MTVPGGIASEDEGVGFDPVTRLSATESVGLNGMQERTLALGGLFDLDSVPGAGTRLTVELPLPAEPEGGP